MVTNKYIWINRDILNLNLIDRKLGLLCRLAELMVEDGTIMEKDEKKPAKDKYLCNFIGINTGRFSRAAKDLIDHQVIFYDSQTHTYKMNEKYVVLPSSKTKYLRRFIKVSCSNFDKLFPNEFDTRFFSITGHLVRLALHIGFGDNSVRDNVYCLNKSEFIHLSLDEVFADYSNSNIRRIESMLKKLCLKGKPCVEFYSDKIVINPLLFNTTGIVVRKNSETNPFTSEGEEATRLFLEKYDLNYEAQKRFDGLIGVNGGQLSYDFFLPDNNILIECQGSQHYRFGDYTTEEGFMIQREHDHRKWEYAKNNSYILIELPYWHYKDAEEYLNKILKKLLTK